MTVNFTFFLILSMTEKDHCKRYDKVENDQKRLLWRVIFGKIMQQFYEQSSKQYSEKDKLSPLENPRKRLSSE